MNVTNYHTNKDIRYVINWVWSSKDDYSKNGLMNSSAHKDTYINSLAGSSFVIVSEYKILKCNLFADFDQLLFGVIGIKNVKQPPFSKRYKAISTELD